MTVKELKDKLDEFNPDMEVWLASGFLTEPIININTCVDMDTNITHLELAGKYKNWR